jgi:hypothetical protein
VPQENAWPSHSGTTGGDLINAGSAAYPYHWVALTFG